MSKPYASLPSVTVSNSVPPYERPQKRPHQIFDAANCSEICTSEPLPSLPWAQGGGLPLRLGRAFASDGQDRPLDPRRGDLYHLRQSGLVQTIPALGRDRALVVLTERGRALLEANRHPSANSERPRPAVGRDHHDSRQEFYAGFRKPKELTHDAQVYRAYLRAAGQLCERGATVRRVVVDYELKREYQQFLQAHNRGRSDSDGRSDRTPEEIRSWALAHDLPEQDGHVQFPDARIEYEDVDGRLRTEDIEVTTAHDRGGHLAAKATAGFNCYRGSGARIVKGGGGGSYAAGGSPERREGWPRVRPPRCRGVTRFGTGCRLEEIRGIDPKRNIDWVRGTVHVLGKFAKERDVPMQPDAKAALKEQLDAESKLWTQNQQRLREVLAEGAVRAHVAHLTPHTLRHSFGTR